MNQPIYITKSSVPPLGEFNYYLKKIWKSRIFTNNGVFHKKLESKLSLYTSCKNVSLFCNGTMALIMALKALKIKGEVITTPYTFAATSHSLLWCNLKPVFCDVNINDYNIDPSKIEALITERTSAILAVHCYGIPCDVEALEKIAKKYSLKLIFDAAHAFGVKFNGKSLVGYGDASVLSFHATKTFHTIEGGAVIVKNKKTKVLLDRLKNFGIKNEHEIPDIGINAKLSEINAAFGLLLFKNLKKEIALRKKVYIKYAKALSCIDGIEIYKFDNTVEPNFSYFPIIVNKEFRYSRDELYERFRAKRIFVRKYFYPLLSNLDSYKIFSKNSDLHNANFLSQKILCLPIYSELHDAAINKILRVMKDGK